MGLGYIAPSVEQGLCGGRKGEGPVLHIEGNWVDFRFFRPQANRVCIAGDFNNWREDELVMSRDRDGHWHARVRLPAGEWKFRYFADGEWFTDYAASGVEIGPFGLDSLIRIPAGPVRLAAAHSAATASDAYSAA